MLMAEDLLQREEKPSDTKAFVGQVEESEQPAPSSSEVKTLRKEIDKLRTLVSKTSQNGPFTKRQREGDGWKGGHHSKRQTKEWVVCSYCWKKHPNAEKGECYQWVINLIKHKEEAEAKCKNKDKESDKQLVARA
eukprot:CAMPEP_0181330146 /NCGR_PEP_ID=MMETSP1101-20121128/23728_1 /TAXON_ID=46948 /ORGANISM="Rhodomonas abbreviata, Strain Caron Lab Isolate" /LENGTH=134 /DNA_ID=CAMNT_0023439351 /DNA_START=181 /DNA_END=581 /DNA_ORIENTATION=+